MKEVLIKHLFITFLCIAPAIGHCAGNNIFVSSNVIQDSAQIELNRKISGAKGDSLEYLKAFFEYGEYLNETGNTGKSIEQFNIALRIARNTDNNAQMATVANYLANMYAGIGDFNASYNAYLIALYGAEKTGNSGEIAKISMNLASNYNYTGDYKNAIKYGLYALKIKETRNNMERICYHYIAMGNIFRENNNYAKWEEYVQKAYKMKDVEGCASFSDIAKIYNSLGGITVHKEEYGKALLYYDTLMVLSQEVNYNQGISTALTNSAGVYKQLGNFQKALDMATESEKYFGENPYDKIFNNNFKAELFQLIGHEKKGLELAVENIKIKEIDFYSTEKLKCLKLLYELNYSLSNYNEAFSWNDSLRTTEDRLRDEDIRESIEDLETKYETEKKEQRIELLTAENKLKNQRNNASIGIVIVLLIVILFIVYILNIRKKQALLVQNDLQQQVLRSQMNPHFIFNVLGSIQNFLLGNDNKKAADYLTQFASLTRSTLEYSASEFISLTDEIRMLRDYMELEKMRNPGKFNIEIITDKEIESDFIQIPPMMIQPFIENSIKHGFINLDYPGLLILKITDKSRWIEFIVEDNGKGLSAKDSGHSHRSMATEIFEKRRKLIQQKHKKEFIFEILNLKEADASNSGVRVTINVPVLNYD